MPGSKFPPAPASHIDWKSLTLATPLPALSHVECTYTASTSTWSAPVLRSSPTLSVSGLAPGLNYGQQCYEGLKAFRSVPSPNQPTERITVFRPAFHAARLNRSAAAVCLPDVPEPLFLECLRMCVVANAEFVPPSVVNLGVGGKTKPTHAFLYVRPLLFGSSAQLMLAPPETVTFAVFAQPGAPYHGTPSSSSSSSAAASGPPMAAGLDALVLEDFDRCAPRGTGAYKVGGNYAPVWRHAAAAKAKGYPMTLHVDSADRESVEEFSTSGFLGYRLGENEEKTLVVPKTENAIASATSDSLVRLAEREGWTVERVKLPLSALSTLTEAVAVGTAAAAVPIRSVTRESTAEKYTFAGTASFAVPVPGSSTPPPNLLRLAAMMTAVQVGAAPDTEGWCWEVRAEESELAENSSRVEAQEMHQPTLARRLASSLYPRAVADLWAFATGALQLRSV